MPAIQVSNVVKKFGDVAAVNDISFSVPENKIFGLLGSNGAGKTTLINIITGLLLPDEGTISVLGMDALKEIEKIRKSIALVPQSISLYNMLTVYENIEFFGGMYIGSNEELKDRIEEVIRILGLKDNKNVQIRHLSGGFQRRCSIACALIAKPKILFLDEPLTGIDIATRDIVTRFIKSIKGITIILTTHSNKEAEAVCDELIFIDKGKKILEGNPKQIISRYAEDIGEKIRIQFDTAMEAHVVENHLKKSGFHVSHIKTENKTLSFISKNIGSNIIDIIDSLKPIESHVLDIDLIKPSLDDILRHIMQNEVK